MQTLGPYELMDEIGRGGAGAVWRALSPSGAIVAVKLLVRLDAERIARFDRERRLLDTLGEEQGFVPLLDHGDSPQGPYLVMPFYAAGTLRRRLDEQAVGGAAGGRRERPPAHQEGRMPLEVALELGRALARAVANAHAKKIVHRDLKPDNVLFTARGAAGRPLIADLGLAKHFAREDEPRTTSLSRSGELRGSAGYMAPEQLRDAKTVGPPADVFALGSILYECVAGVPAFEGETFIEIVKATDRGELVPLEERVPEAPVWLARVVERALARSPAGRFPDAAAFAGALADGSRRLARSDSPRSPKGGPPRCLVEGCAAVHFSRGLCGRHLALAQKRIVTESKTWEDLELEGVVLPLEQHGDWLPREEEK